MDNASNDSSDKESSEKRNSNSEWLPTKCRITKPPPPKPATNPLQFVKVTPSALFQKAHEQMKKVEEIKTKRHAVKEDAEEWQQNLDNWKSSRRKRQEHIIERVVEVKKLEQESYDRSRRKSKTFNEMLEDRNKRGYRVNIPIFDDDSNDLSDYGIGSCSSKTNSIKDVDTDDSSSFLDDKDPGSSASDSQSGKDASSTSNQSQSEDELLNSTNHLMDHENSSKNIIYETCDRSDNCLPTIYTNKSKSTVKPAFDCYKKIEGDKPEDYTYQRAIEDYRSKILPKLNESENIFTVKCDRNAALPVSKLEMYAPKQPETKIPIEMTHLELNASRRLSEEFANSLSVKERLKSLQKCSELQMKGVEKKIHRGSVKSLIESLTKQGETDIKNNNLDFSRTTDSSFVKNENIHASVSLFLIDNNSENNSTNTRNVLFDRGEDPEEETYINKLNQFNEDLDSYLIKLPPRPQSSSSDGCGHSTDLPSMSSTELIGTFSDREDSGIHTADVSCSVSQADESVEYTYILSSTIPNCIEKLQKEREKEQLTQVECKLSSKLEKKEESVEKIEGTENIALRVADNKILMQSTQAFLDNIRQHINNDYKSQTSSNILPVNRDVSNLVRDSYLLQQDLPFVTDQKVQCTAHCEFTSTPVIYENVAIKDYDNYLKDAFVNSTFPLAPPKTKEPPKEKPPPPPPTTEEDEKLKQSKLIQLNSTKRIRKEMHIKRSSFLGLDKPMNDIDSGIMTDNSTDINLFLEKSIYRKYQDSRETCPSEVESQDSGLESERSHLSNDMWCSSLGESNISLHCRQNSEQTHNSVTSEEDEISKKEREIIALVEKEEKSKDCSQYSTELACCSMVHKMNGAKNEEFKIQYFPKNYLNYNRLQTDQDSEVLKVEHELLLLEKEELERQKQNMVFRENKDKLLCKNRYSLENICDAGDAFSGYYENISCRKSMPELSKDLHTGNYNRYQNYKPVCGIDTRYRKSMPDIQQAYLKSESNYVYKDLQLPLEHRKSMSDLQKASSPYTFFNKQPIMPGKPLTSVIKEQRDRNKLLRTNPSFELDFSQCQNLKSDIPIIRPGLNALSALPTHRNILNENWIRPKINGDNKPKSYDKHWLFQEAELRRLADQKTNTSKWNCQQMTPKINIPEPSIQTLTQKVPNLTLNERNPHNRRSENINQEITHNSPYLNRSQTVDMSSICYPPLTALENSDGKVLSVSGKKKCSFCGNELGRGAAMIIESLCLFYHMECFKCCVCHILLGDGLMGTDVRVRNQKLHCHNCYTSDDGVKFSCV